MSGIPTGAGRGHARTPANRQARVDAAASPGFPGGVDPTPAAGPLVARRIADTFALSDAELGKLFGVSQQTASQWLASGFPAAQQAEAAAVLEIARLLDHYLQAGRIGAIARRPAAAYGGRSMHEMIEAGEHEALLAGVRASFDFCWTA